VALPAHVYKNLPGQVNTGWSSLLFAAYSSAFRAKLKHSFGSTGKIDFLELFSSFDLGFEHPSHFTKLLKNGTGVIQSNLEFRINRVILTRPDWHVLV
jgi:hypothetical protein